MVVKSSAPRSEPKKPGNIYDAFAKRMLGQVLVFIDFLLNYADKEFVDEIDLTQIQPAPTHYFGKDGDERISDLVFSCPLKNNDKKKTSGKNSESWMAVIVFEHQSKNLKDIPHKLLKIVSAIWEGEKKEGKKVLSAPYFLVLRTGKKPFRGTPPKMSASLPKGRDGKPLGKMVEIDYDVVDLPAWDVSKLVGGAVLRLTLGILHKMTGGNEDEFPEALLPLREVVDVGERVELTNELLGFVDKAFKARGRSLDTATIRAAMQTVFQGEGESMIKSFIDEREAIGEARGEAKGEVKAGRNMVLKALRKKFKRVPKHIEQAVLSMSDSIALESLLEHAIDSDTLDEFATAL